MESGVDPGTSGVAGLVTMVAALVTTVVDPGTTVVVGPAMSGVALATTVEAATVTGTAAVIVAARRPRVGGFAEALPGCPPRRPAVRSRPSGRA